MHDAPTVVFYNDKLLPIARLALSRRLSLYAQSGIGVAVAYSVIAWAEASAGSIVMPMYKAHAAAHGELPPEAPKEDKETARRAAKQKLAAERKARALQVKAAKAAKRGDLRTGDVASTTRHQGSARLASMCALTCSLACPTHSLRNCSCAQHGCVCITASSGEHS